MNPWWQKPPTASMPRDNRAEGGGEQTMGSVNFDTGKNRSPRKEVQGPIFLGGIMMIPHKIDGVCRVFCGVLGLMSRGAAGEVAQTGQRGWGQRGSGKMSGTTGAGGGISCEQYLNWVMGP
jgi:hypothetical protein